MQLVEVASGCGFVEGPVVMQDSSLVVGSISHGRLYQIQGGACRVFAEVGGGPNGVVEAADGSIYVAQMGSRKRASPTPPITGGIQHVSRDGGWTWLTQDPISPNDLCFGLDGLLYWTDPTRRRWDDGRLWRCSTTSSEPQLLISVPWYPNGIAFGLEDDAVYVAVYGEQQITRFTLTADGLGKPELVIQMSTGHPDGLAFDIDGNLIVAANSTTGGRGQIQTWSIDGRLLDVFEPGDHSLYTNIALDSDRNLFITDSEGGSILRVSDWPVAGLPLHPFRPTPDKNAQRIPNSQ